MRQQGHQRKRNVPSHRAHSSELPDMPRVYILIGIMAYNDLQLGCLVYKVREFFYYNVYRLTSVPTWPLTSSKHVTEKAVELPAR